MTRNLKALGLALIVVFAMSIMVASAAQAEETPTLTAETAFPVTIHGTGGKGEILTVFGEFSCNVSHFHGIVTDAGWTANPSTITVTPTYTDTEGAKVKGCSTKTGASTLPTEVHENGCGYLFHVTKTDPTESADKADSYVGKMDIECPAGKVLEFTEFTNEEAKALLCTTTIPPQTGLEQVTFTNDTTASPKPDITVSGTVKGIEATIHRESILCPQGEAVNPETEATKKTTTFLAEYHINTPITLTGVNTATFAPTGISISHP